MTQVAPAMTYEPGDLERAADHVEVLEVDGEVVGVFRLLRRTELAFLEDLFVDSESIGHGYGRILFERAVEVARGWGFGVMEFESDPNAEPIYLHLGAERVGMSPATLIPGRSIPLMRYALWDRSPGVSARGSRTRPR